MLNDNNPTIKPLELMKREANASARSNELQINRKVDKLEAHILLFNRVTISY